MSHHMLMPIAYTPEVKPKKLEPKKSRVQMRGAGSVDGTDEAGETFEPAGIGLPLQNFAPIEGADQKPQHPKGRLSEGTLKAMLQAQELEL
jgi:hypothetical protein